MLPDTERVLHIGINFLLAPTALSIDTQHELEFRRLLADDQLEFERTERVDQSVKLSASRAEPLEIRVGQAGPQVGQLLIVTPQPTQPFETFYQQTETVCHAFQNVWRVSEQQIINRDACIRYLYQSAAHHAFRFLWEKRLRQNANDMRILDRPVLGGGLRLVMPPSDGHRTQVEVKIESFLRDSRMLFVELQFAWPFPVTPKEGFRPRELLMEIREYCQRNVVPFILGDSGQEGGQRTDA
jgi:hypothetical protein